MKKFFTLIAMALMAVGANAQTKLINYPESKDGITLKTTDPDQVTYSTVKIHTNTDAVEGIKFGKSFKNETAEYYYAELSVAGGFKTGDVITIAGAYNHDDEKTATIAFRSALDGSAFYTTENFVNGKKSADDPVDQKYTLQADADALYIGRSGGTGTFITKLIITRGTTGINAVKSETIDVNAPVYNLAGQQVDKSYKGVVIQNGVKHIQK
ncbi:hypothetical protein SAMN04487851_10891 [Prevotella sp. tc2-28]|uniref:hypothetical protein n=1 Tax=Prevotella sp. tc2-28 TaxID=1761888 RepID=UPI00089BBA7D|nr:hypothetical protein [Prevotella sp. tc2-28]SEA56002.1 hypothetical protein SAMN04487851_10891 [Prevotella sp. tc2-28]